jgi:hypothetical protein
MAKLKELLQEKGLELILLGLAGALGALLTVVWKEISVPLIQKFLPSISTTAWASIASILFLMLSMTWIYILLSRKKTRNYRFDKRLGIWFHKKTKEPYCPSCLMSNLESPLKVSEDGWRCRKKDCLQFYSNPDHKKPTGKGREGPWFPVH